MGDDGICSRQEKVQSRPSCFPISCVFPPDTHFVVQLVPSTDNISQSELDYKHPAAWLMQSRGLWVFLSEST